MKFHPKVIALLAFALVLAISPATNAQKTKLPGPVRAEVTVTAQPGRNSVPLSSAQQKRQDAFTKVWQTLNDNYFDKTFNGLDWYKIRDDYQRRVSAAGTDAEVHSLILDMVSRLDRSHFGLIPPEYFESLKEAKMAARQRERSLSGGADRPQAKTDAEADDDDDLFKDPDGKYGIGVELRLIDDRFVITYVDDQSAAMLAGIKPGFVIDKINGVAMTDLVSRILLAYPNIRHLRRYLPTQIVEWFLNGRSDTSVQLTCLDQDDQPREFTIPRLNLSGQAISFGERFPEQFLQYKSIPLSADVGYVKFNVFGMPVIGKFCDSLTQFSSKKAIIVDLRGNIGGILGTLYGLTGMLTDHTIVLGTSLYRSHSEALTVGSKLKNYKGKIVVLIDDQTMSAAEFFSAGLQENSRALLVGERTAGEALPAVSITLATGAVFQYPISNFRTFKGKYLEANGVEPNVTVARDRKSLLNGIDTQLEKALAIIADGTSFPIAPTTIGGAGSGNGPKRPPPVSKTGDGRGSVSPPEFKLSRIGSSGLSTGPATISTAKDPRALKVLANFADAIGGVDAVRNVNSYEAVGKDIVGFHGSETEMKFRAYRQLPGKYAVVMTSDVLGDLRQVYNGKGAFMQSDFGIDTDIGYGRDLSRTHLFEAVTNLLDPEYMRSLSYDGVYEVDGKKLDVIEGKTNAGASIALTFDVQTKLLVRFTGPGLMYTFGDFRKVGNLSLPFLIKLDGVMEIKLESVTLNPKLDPVIFEKKENCFDRSN